MTCELLDNTVLNNFSRIERPDLIRLVLNNPATTPHVLRELQSGVASGALPACDWTGLPVLDLTPPEESRLAEFAEILGLGEASCIAVALERGGRFLTDDRAARRFAGERGLEVSGTLGILTRLVEEGHLILVQADTYLATMIAMGYRSPVQSLRELGRT